MTQYGANKVATAVLLDVSQGMELPSANGQTHFDQSKWVLSRIILRKIFAYETDEVGILAFGPDGINVVSDLAIPTWETFRKADDLSTASKSSKAGNWAQGIIKAVDFLEEQCQGKRFKNKQLVVLSNFTWSSPDIGGKLETLVAVVNARGLNVVVIGIDIKKESQDENDLNPGLGELLTFISKLENGVTLSFEEVYDDMKYYDKKKKAKRLTKANMKIGSEISLPFKWMKVTTEDTRLKFMVPERKAKTLFSDSTNGAAKRPEEEGEMQGSLKKLKTDFLTSTTNQSISKCDVIPFEVKYEQDESRKTRFGATEVLLSYADLEALKRKTGPPSFTFLGTVKSSKITRAMIISPDVYVLVPDGTKRSQAQLGALVTALLKQNKYGLARRIASKDGKVNLGILYPVMDELGKVLYFLKTPVADWVKSVPTRCLPDTVEPPLANMMSELFDKMSIEGRGRDLLLKDPNFQWRSARVEHTVRGTEIPAHVFELFDPYPELIEAGDPVIRKILEVYPIPSAPSEEAVGANKSEEPTTEPKKELTDEEKKEIQEIKELVTLDPDSLLIDGEMLYQNKVETQRMDTEDVFKLIQSQ